MSSLGELDWFKSSYSGSESGSCGEVAFAVGGMYVRDFEERGGPQFVVRAVARRDFVGRVKR